MLITSALCLYFVFSSCLVSQANALAANVCGDDSWTLFKDEKCFKLVEQFVTLEEALDICRQEIGSVEPHPLLTIDYAEEQEFVTKFIFQDLHLADNVWLGAKRVDGSATDFQWLNGAPLNYTHWNVDSPSGDVEKDCVQVISHLSKNSKLPATQNAPNAIIDGDWTDVSCLKRNLVLCQKAQSWSMSEFQQAILEIRRQLNQTSDRVGVVETKIDHVVPIGFLYVQYRDQAGPDLIWPQFTWTDVTTEYAGEFFRAVGGDSADFGTIQTENVPRVTRVEYLGQAPSEVVAFSVDLTVGQTSPYLVSGYNDAGGNYDVQETIRFVTSGGEVRPRNSGVQLWKRTA